MILQADYSAKTSGCPACGASRHTVRSGCLLYPRGEGRMTAIGSVDLEKAKAAVIHYCKEKGLGKYAKKGAL